MAKRGKFPNRKELRQKTAIARQERWAGLSEKQQLQELDLRGHGHCKQAKALTSLLFPDLKE